MPSIFGFLKTQEAIKKDYDIETAILGQGKFAKVYKCRSKEDGKEYACKVILKEKCMKEEEDKIKGEIDIMKKVKHPNCIAFHEMYESKEKLYIVMELVTGGELFDRIIDKGHFSEHDAADCFHQIILAVEYLHNIGIVHRDIKPENILYVNPSPESPIKLVDFGLGKIVDIHGHGDHIKHMKTVCGTPSYLAPEIIQRKGYGEECDIWSSGVILYIILSGHPPFDQSAPIPSLFNSILNARYSFPREQWSGVSESAKDLIKKMLMIDTNARLKPVEILHHPWMLGYHSDDLNKQCLGVQQRLQEWQATKRLKAAINTFVALLRMSSSVLGELPDEAEQQKILQQVRSDAARIEVLRDSFATLDKEKSGVLDVSNISESMKSLGVQKNLDEVRAMVSRFDIYSKGVINFDEYCIMMGPGYYTEGEQAKMLETGSSRWEFELRSIFEAFDLEGTGTVNKKELREIMRRLGITLTEKDLDSTLYSADTNHDGVIDWDEFKSFMTTNHHT